RSYRVEVVDLLIEGVYSLLVLRLGVLVELVDLRSRDGAFVADDVSIRISSVAGGRVDRRRLWSARARMVGVVCVVAVGGLVLMKRLRISVGALLVLEYPDKLSGLLVLVERLFRREFAQRIGGPVPNSRYEHLALVCTKTHAEYARMGSISVVDIWAATKIDVALLHHARDRLPAEGFGDSDRPPFRLRQHRARRARDWHLMHIAVLVGVEVEAAGDVLQHPRWRNDLRVLASWNLLIRLRIEQDAGR